MLSGLIGVLDPRQERYLTRIKVNADRLSRMIADLMDRTRIETGKIEISRTEIALFKLIDEVLEQLSPLSAVKKQRVELRCIDRNMTVMGDWDKLSQIMINLLDNAMKYTPEEGDITVYIEKEGPDIGRIRVCDTGCGIPLCDLPNVFDSFFRVARQNSHEKGLGLGLSIVKALVEAHQGRIEAHSEEGRGTEFIFTLPLCSEKEWFTLNRAEETRRLLVVDDDPDLRLMLYDRLTGEGYAVETVGSGVEALEKLSTPYDGILLDINLPGIDGLDVLRRIREGHPSTPVIMLTASENKDLAEEALTLGAEAYLLKPFDAFRMKEFVAHWFSGKSRQPV